MPAAAPRQTRAGLDQRPRRVSAKPQRVPDAEGGDMYIGGGVLALIIIILLLIWLF
jgi:hypothetical protein